MKRLSELLDQALAKREPVALCTVVSTSGSTPMKSGAKMLVWENGKSTGTIGGGAVEKKVTGDAIRQLKEGVSKLNEYPLLKENMCCGGTMRLFIEPLKPQNQLFIFGAGHIGSHLAYYAGKLDFKTLVIDERPEMLDTIHGAETEKIFLPHHEALTKLIFDKYTYIVICTHLHAYDREILAACLRKPHAYLGMIGSKRKVLVTRKMFLDQNIATEAELEKTDMPLGFNIGQNSPAEIALGILAKIVAVSNGKNLVEIVLQNNTSPEEELLPDECIQKPIVHGE